MDVGLGVVVGVVSEWDAGWGVEVELWVWEGWFMLCGFGAIVFVVRGSGLCGLLGLVGLVGDGEWRGGR